MRTVPLIRSVLLWPPLLLRVINKSGLQKIMHGTTVLTPLGVAAQTDRFVTLPSAIPELMNIDSELKDYRH